MSGGEARVLEILETDSQRQLVQPFLKEDDEEKQGRPLRQRSSIINFFCHPCVIGRDLFNIERFGLVQYVNNTPLLLCSAIAAITHAYVFPADPYQYVPDHPKNGNLKAAIDRRSSSSKEKLNLGGSGNKEGVVEKKETRVEAAGTSVSESVQDIVVQGGQHVVKDVVLTINQAMGPVEKGVTKIHQTFHRRSMSSGVEEGAEGEAEIVLEK
ncbi:Protein LAZ1 homolog 2 [Linum perenne]